MIGRINETPIMSALADRRRAVGLTRQDIADEIGCTVRAVSRWESEDAEPRLVDVEDYARAVGYDVVLRLKAGAS